MNQSPHEIRRILRKAFHASNIEIWGAQPLPVATAGNWNDLIRREATADYLADVGLRLDEDRPALV